jgi:hypothetical protein
MGVRDLAEELSLDLAEPLDAVASGPRFTISIRWKCPPGLRGTHVIPRRNDETKRIT